MDTALKLAKISFFLALCAGLAGCGNDYSSHERIGPWTQTGPVTVKAALIYHPALAQADGTVKHFDFCTSYPLEGLKEGMVIDLRYREVNKYQTIDDPCDEFENYKILKDVK